MITQQSIAIDGEAPYQIFGTLTSCDNDASKLIINLHGLTHSQWGYLQQNCITPFTDAGYDVFNFSFYDRMPNSRRMHEASLSAHCADFLRVLDYFSDRYEHIYLTGHSLGGLITLITNPDNIKAVSLWDPALDVTHFWSTGNYLTSLPEQNGYKLDYGTEFVISAKLVEEIKTYSNSKCLELAATFQSPAQMIIPALSIFLSSPHTSPAQYDDAFSAPYERINMEDTDHCFYGVGHDQKLFAHTIAWFNKFV